MRTCNWRGTMRGPLTNCDTFPHRQEAAPTRGTYLVLTAFEERTMKQQLSSIRTAGAGAFGLAAIAVLTLALFSADVLAQSRRVFVNGQRLSDAQVASLARMNCAAIPDGAYWVDNADGSWGYAGNPQIQGIVGERCNSVVNTAAGSDARRHGPYATMRRAQEVANQLRGQGLRTVAFHNGNGYWVDARR
jgi:hypothetical protein